jgi:hypothetical protein
LRHSTIGIWTRRVELLKQSTAATNLKSKLQAIKVNYATESTALAIYLNANLRLSNLEKYYPFLNYLAYPSHHCTQLHELTSVPPCATTTSSAYSEYFSNPNLPNKKLKTL